MALEMKSKGLIYCCIIFMSLFCVSFADNLTIIVLGNYRDILAVTDETFVCATLDWWPENKSDFGFHSWGKAGILNLDLDNKVLENAVKAFGNLRIRVGGSLQDQVDYKLGASLGNCTNFTSEEDGLFGFSRGCLDMGRWNRMNKFFYETGAVITFGLNALNGRHNKSTSDGSTLMEGAWDSTNAYDFMSYNAYKGFKIDSYEFGNELSGSGIAVKVDAEQYAKDIIILKKLIQKLYPNNSANKPSVLGPGGFYDEDWFKQFLSAAPVPSGVDGVTYHIYNLGSGKDQSVVLNGTHDPDVVNEANKTYYKIKTDMQPFGLNPWVSESGGSYSSGARNVSNTFANGFWYLNQLGLTAKYNHPVFCRQTLIGGNYGLLNATTFIPNPDYYGALLFHRLMGKTVLPANHNGSDFLRVYAHCSKNNTKGVSVLIINMSKSKTFEVKVEDNTKSYHVEDAKQREEYHLTPKGGSIQSEVVLLNGKPLNLTETFDIPTMDPRLVNATSPIRAAPYSIVFVTITDYNASACA
ncbi:hypothetical protein CASFOL_020748 [Castilleja foliolosa]|uniref:Heparanase-like protein 2 n=1 Tax=Castilleja foliolosa TaxID=1961234 RepID=A0ABD3D1Q6_9LAMI